METEKSIFYSQKRLSLQELGYIESAAEKGFFDDLLKEMRLSNPEAECVQNTGTGSIHQIIFLPKFRKKLERKLKSELLEYERDAKHTRAAIASLCKNKGRP